MHSSSFHISPLLRITTMRSTLDLMNLASAARFSLSTYYYMFSSLHLPREPSPCLRVLRSDLAALAHYHVARELYLTIYVRNARARADNAAATRRCFPPRTSVSSSSVCMYSGANCQRTPTLWRSRTFTVPAVMHPSSVNMKIWLERARAGAVDGRALCGDNGRAERPALGLPSAITFSPLHSHLGYECGLDLEKECRESGKSLDDATRREAP